LCLGLFWNFIKKGVVEPPQGKSSPSVVDSNARVLLLLWSHRIYPLGQRNTGKKFIAYGEEHSGQAEEKLMLGISGGTPLQTVYLEAW